MSIRTHAALGISASLLLIASVALADVPTVVVEAKCASGGSYVEGGTGWGNSSSKSNKTSCPNGSRSSKNGGAWADFIPPIVTEGYYNIYMTWGATTSSNNGPNAESVKVTIMGDGLTEDVYVNMRGHSACTDTNANQLVLVGTGYFKPGQGHKVRVSHVATGQCYNGASKRYVSADAVEFEYMTPVPTVPKTWGAIKARYPN